MGAGDEWYDEDLSWYMPSNKETLAVMQSWRWGEYIDKYKSWMAWMSAQPGANKIKPEEDDKKKKEMLNPQWKVQSNQPNPTGKFVKPALAKALIDKYNSFESDEEAEAYKSDMLQKMQAAWYNTANVFKMDSIGKVVDNATIEKGKQDNTNRINRLPTESQLALAAARGIFGKNLTAEQKKAAALQSIINKADELKKANPSLDIETIKAKAIEKINNRIDKSIVKPQTETQNGIYTEYTHQAPNGKTYQLRTNRDTGQTEFVDASGARQKYNNKQQALTKINNENPTGSQYGQDNVAWSQNTYMQWAKTTKDWKVVTDNETAQAMLDTNEDTKNNNLDIIREQEAKQQLAMQEMIDRSEDISDEQKWIINTRMQWVFDTFANINNIIGDLKAKAQNLFDQKATRSADARAKQLADKWYLLDDQAAAVSQYSLADYKRDIEIQRAEIEKTIAEKLIEVEQEKGKLIDAINKDASTNAAQKQNQINYINSVMNAQLDALNNKKIETNNAFNQNVWSVLGVAYQSDVAAAGVEKQSAAELAAEQARVRAASWDETARTYYIMDKITKSNPEAAAYAQSVISDLISRNDTAWFLRQNLQSLVGRITSAAMAKANAEKAALMKIK